MSTGSAFGLGFVLSVVATFLLGLPLSDAAVNAFSAVMSLDYAKQLGVLIALIVPGLVFFGVPLINAKCIVAVENKRAEAAETRKRKYQDNPLAGELAEKVYLSMADGIEGAYRGKRNQIISVGRTVEFDSFRNCFELGGNGVGYDSPSRLLYNGESENAFF